MINADDDDYDVYEESGEVDAEEVSDEVTDGWYHLGYYLRRIQGELVLVQSLVSPTEDGDDADAQTLYVDLDALEPSWLDAVHDQGVHLLEGKSCEFIPPEDEDEDDYSAEDEDY